MKERESFDVWDVLNKRLRAPAAAASERPWYQHRNAPTPEEQRQRPPSPRPKPRTAPPMPPNKGDQQWWQDKRIPRQWQEEPKKKR